MRDAEAEVATWDTGWSAEAGNGHGGAGGAGGFSRSGKSQAIFASSLGTLAHLGVTKAHGGRIARVRALALQRPAAVIMLVVFLLCFMLTCFAPLVPMLRLGFDVVDTSRRVSALRELVGNDPAQLMSSANLAQAQAQVVGIQQDLYEINGAMNIVAAPWAASSASIRNYRLLVRMGLDLTSAAGNSLQVAQTVLRPVQGGLISNDSASSGITMADIQQARQLLADARSHLVDAEQTYNQLDQRSLPGPFKPPSTIGKLLALTPTAISAIDELNTLLDIAPSLLGVGQPAYYLVAAMDSTELRPGGGFIGNYGILALSGGKQVPGMPLSLSNTYPLDQKYYQNALEPYRIQQHAKTFADVKGCASLGPQPPAYFWWWPVRDFDTTCTYGWGLRDANLSASFPDNARMMMRIVESVSGEVPDNAPLQGTIAFTPGLIKGLLQITGPIVVPQFNVKVNADNLEATIHKYQLTDARPKGGDRKAFTHLLSGAMLARLKTLHGDELKSVVKVGLEALKSKDLQIYFSDPRAELMLRQLGLAGEVRTGGGDGFMVADANDGGNKANAYVTERQTDVVTLLPNGGAIHHLQIVVTYDKGRNSVYPGNTQQDDYSDFQRTYLPGNATILGSAGFNPNTFIPAGCYGSGVSGYGSIISDCPPQYAIVNPVTTSDVPGRTMVGGALLVLCGQYSTFVGTGREYQSCEKTPKAHSQTIYISWYTPNAFAPQTNGHGSYTEVVEHQAGNPQWLTVYVDTSQLQTASPALASTTPDMIIAGSTPKARNSAFALLVAHTTKVFDQALTQDQTVMFNF